MVEKVKVTRLIIQKAVDIIFGCNNYCDVNSEQEIMLKGSKSLLVIKYSFNQDFIYVIVLCVFVSR